VVRAAVKAVGIAAALGLGLLVAGCVALYRPDIPYEQLDTRYASPESRWEALPGGVRMHYRDQGRADGPVIVLVHGFAASLHTWEPWVRELGDAYRVVSVDLPGFGLTRTPPDYRLGPTSYVDALEAFAAARGLERFTLAGNSMGGAAAWQYALAHPERLQALVLVDAAGWPAQAGEEDEGPLVFKLLGTPVGRALLRDLDSTALTRSGLKSAIVDDALVTDSMVRRYTDLSRAPGRRALILATMESRRAAPASRERLAALRTPTLVMTGEEDNLVPAAHARLFAEAIPGARLVAYPGVGHIPMEEIPARSAADVRAFLQPIVGTGAR
jgi:pimeloyl-ACP methyl ester carboxylesterase